MLSKLTQTIKVFDVEMYGNVYMVKLHYASASNKLFGAEITHNGYEVTSVLLVYSILKDMETIGAFNSDNIDRGL